jgi:hypothetical protein
MYSTNARNGMLDAIGITHASLHTAYSSTGANEVTGGSPAYARKSATFAAASGGARAASNAPVFDVPAAATVRFVGYWDAVSAGNFKGMVGNGGTEKEFAVDLTADTVKVVAHGWSADQKIVFYGGTAPGALSEGTVYFVRAPATDTFQVAATAGGAAINLTSEAGADCVVSAIVEETFAAQGTFTVSSSNLNLNG